MSNANFNRQFIMLDFRLLEDSNFLAFLSSSEFATYLILRRNVWRSSERHYMALDVQYLSERRLACSLTREKIAQTTGVRPNQISHHLSKLATEWGVIRRVRTGRQSIYILGEWLDVRGDGSHKLEWFYMDGAFGISKNDLLAGQNTDTRSSVRQTSAGSGHQTSATDGGQPPASGGDNNKEENRQGKSVNGWLSLLKALPDLDEPQDKTRYVVQTILDALGDEHSAKFYRLVAAKVPEGIVRRLLAEIKADGADHPARLFTHKVKQWAVKKQRKGLADTFSSS